jgi:threonyl-tRNA synthetase
MNDDLKKIRHSLAHVLALAVLRTYPNVKFAIGPDIANGFYYDIDFGDVKISDDDLLVIEKKMKHIIKQNLKFEKTEKDINDAILEAKSNDDTYKLELLEELKEQGESKVTFYSLGEFHDLCRGPHLEATSKIISGSFKLDKLAGAYWRGDEKNKMLTRIYGLSFESKEKLDEHVKMVEELKKRDHRKIGQELDLFCFSELVGPGLPMFSPKGVIIIDELRNHIEKVCRAYGFQKVMTPHLAKIDLYEISGHAKKFSDELFRVSSLRGHEMAIKPVQCPHQTQIYASKPRSYRDLPIRYMESEKQYRAEKTGEVGGLSRVYAITVEDGHTFCTIDQVKDEIKGMVDIIRDFYGSLGLLDNFWVSLSVRDYDNPDKYIGEPEDWDLCEKILEEVSGEMNLGSKRQEGEAALYGPKLDFMFKDSLGKEIQIPTVQIDFATPKKFNLLYTDKDGKEKHPVMVHRAILGSYERFLVLLIEHFAGSFPLWLSPVQVKILSVGESHVDYCRKLNNELISLDIRSEVDVDNDTVASKIRKATKEKCPYVLVIGDKEVNSSTLAVRKRGQNDTEELKKEDFIKLLQSTIKEKK